MKVTVMPIIIGALAQRFGKGAGGIRNRKTSRDCPDYSIVNIDQNTEMNPGEEVTFCQWKTIS